jgi:hypothetical protein
MLARIVNATAIAAFACIVLGFGIIEWEMSSPASPHQQTSKGGRYSAKESPSRVAIPKTAEDRIADYTWWLAAFTFALVTVSFFQIFFLTRADKTARTAADAAKLNAEALMAAEGAALYPVLKKINLKAVFQGTILHPTMPDTNILSAPEVVYCFKNYGKTPAVIESVMHGIRFYPTGSTSRTMHPIDDWALKIIVGGQETSEISCEISEVFTRGKAKAVLAYEGELLFFGEVFFRDFFDRRFQCFWEFEGRPDGFHLRKIDQRPNPDPKRD